MVKKLAENDEQKNELNLLKARARQEQIRKR
jgi:hypothetical protein